jgi:mono/diheme cytochrome c family protein
MGTGSHVGWFVLLIGCSSPPAAGTLTTLTLEIDAGSLPSADAGSPYDTPVVCTSAQTWTGRASQRMAPGEACIACHSRSSGAPLFAIAGTVYPTAHEPSDCDGIVGATSVTVVIIDATGTTTTLQVNAVGNFYAQVSLTAPYRAKVRSDAGERMMAVPQTSGDCNGCHTRDGANGAPGRIMAP